MSLNKIIVALAQKEYAWECGDPPHASWEALDPQIREDYLLRAGYVFGALKDSCEITEEWMLRWEPFGADPLRENQYALVCETKQEAVKIQKIMRDPHPELVAATMYTYMEVIDADA